MADQWEPFEPWASDSETEPEPRVRETRRRESPQIPWGVRVFIPVVSVLVGLALASMWIVLGGYPRDRAKYGTVGIPGAKTVKLKAGDTRLYFQESGLGDTEQADAPDGLSVEVIPAAGGEPLVIENVPTFFFAHSSDGDTASEVFGRFDAPEEGAYRVVTGTAGIPESSQAPTITIGAKPWAPFGSIAAGAVLLLLLGTVIGFLPQTLIRRRRARRRQRRGRSRGGSASRERRSRESSRRRRYDATIDTDRARRGGSGALSPAIRSSGAESPSEGPESTEPARRGRR